MKTPFTEGEFWPTGETENGRARFCVTRSFTYEGRAGRFTIPDGFVFDGPSVPFWALPFMPVGRMFLPAALHDYLLSLAPKPKKGADKVFHKALLECGVDPVRAYICYLAVRTRR